MKRLGSLIILGAFALAPVTRAQERSAPTDGAAAVDSLSTTAAVVTLSTLERERLLLRGNSLTRAPGVRDPFGTSPNVKLIAQSTAEPRFVPNLGTTIPKLGLRGYVEPKGKPPCALIEVAGQGVYVVRKGDTIGLTISGRSTVLRVVSIEASSARIEAGSLGQVIVVR